MSVRRPYVEESFDYPHYEGRPNVVVIASTPRSGSSLLATLLWSTGVAGAPFEYINSLHLPHFFARWGCTDLKQYPSLLFRHRTSPNGVFSVKIHFNQLEEIEKRYPFETILGTDVRFVRISRADPLDQAISLAIARQTGQWSSLRSPQRPPSYDGEEIEQCLEQILLEKSGWESWLGARQISPIEVTYEEICRDRDTAVKRLLDELQIDSQGAERPTTRHRKQGSDLNRAWRARYLAETKSSSPIREA